MNDSAGDGGPGVANGLVEGTSSPLGGADRNLLLGLLALQNGFIGHHTLVDAVHAWIADKAKPLGSILQGWGALDEGHLTVLSLLVDQHLRTHGDAPRCLGKIEATVSFLGELDSIDDDEIRSRLAEAEPYRPTSLERRGPGRDLAAGPSSSRYRKPIQAAHAAGGLGELFIAEDLELGRRVALKEIRPRDAFDAQTRARFLLEGEVTGNLEHPGIVPVYGLGTYDDGRPYYAMRLIKGKNLKDTIDDFRREQARRNDPDEAALGLRKLLRRFIDICNAIEYAHSRKVLHRDLKPANIMLGKFGETLVVDWGLAKVMGRDEPGRQADEGDAEEGPLTTASSSNVEPTRVEAAHGTPQYMSPEQAVGRIDQLGPTSDVYGLGATLYYMLTGRAPFPDGLTSRIVRGDFPPPTAVDPKVPRALEAVCLKAMATRPGDRYPSAIALAEDVERWLGDQPVSSYKDPFTARAARWVRRHRPLVAGAAALLVTASIALTISNFLVRRESTKKEEALGQSEANFLLATRSIDRMLVQVSEEKLMFQPGMIELRSRLVEEATKFYDELAHRRPADAATRLNLAMIYRHEANTLRLIGQVDRSLEFSGRAVSEYEVIVGEGRRHPLYPDLLDHARIDHGDGLWIAGRSREATEAYRRVIREIGPASTAPAEECKFPLTLGRADLGLGDALCEAGNLPGSGRAYEEAIRLFNACLRRNEADFLGRLLLVPSLCGRGVVAREEGRREGAGRAFDEALQKLDRLDVQFPSNPDARYFRAFVLNARGEWLASDPSGRSAARQAFDVAASLASALSAGYSSTLEYRLEHATALIGRVSVAIEPDRALGPEVDGDLQAARAILETILRDHPDLPKARARLARLLTLEGRIALDRGDRLEAHPALIRASEEWERALVAQPQNPSYRAGLGRALELLRGAWAR